MSLHNAQAPHIRCALLAHAVIATLCLWPLPAPAANITTTWTGTTGDWFDASQWSAGIPANDATNIHQPIINTGAVTLSTSITTSGLTLAAPA